jgi:hypothetical protein
VVPARLACAFVLAVLAAGAGLLQAAHGFNPGGHRWPGGVIRYYNAAGDQSWAVQQAVDAWNSSGAAVRFVAVPAAQAQLRIQHFPRVPCTINAEATVGYGANPRVYVFHRDERSPYCNSYMAAEALAHELGHVLGLEHEVRGCSTMNPTGTLRGPSLCAQAKPWQWRCRLLTADDIAGAVALYGGSARPQSRPRDCDLYPAMRAPTQVRIASTPGTGQFELSFRRPPTVPVPFFLVDGKAKQETYVVGVLAGRCPSDAHAFARQLWNVRPGGLQRTAVRLSPGTYCLAVWGVDGFHRPTPKPAELWVRIP